MILFALDTIGQVVSFSVWDSDIQNPRAELKVKAYQELTQRIADLTETVLTQAKIKLTDIDLIAVSLGPGLFTSLRVGLAFAKGLSLALSKPILGIPAMDALALTAVYSPASLIVTLYPSRPTRPAEVYTALFKLQNEDLIKESDEFACEFSQLMQMLLSRPEYSVIMTGSLPKVSLDELEELQRQKSIAIPMTCLHPSACLIAQTAWQRWQKTMSSDDPLTLLPIYVLPSYAEKSVSK